MTAIGAGQCELTELVANHVLGNQNRDMLLAIVYSDREPDHVGADHRATRPGLDRAAIIARTSALHLFLQVEVNKRTFAN